VIQVFAVRGEVLRRHPLQELDVLVVMEPAHVVRAGAVRPVDLHLVVQAVVQHQTVYDRQPVRLHRVRRPVMKVPHVRIIEIEHALVGHIDDDDDEATARSRGHGYDMMSEANPTAFERMFRIRTTMTTKTNNVKRK